jgi:hypothetical protein
MRFDPELARTSWAEAFLGGQGQLTDSPICVIMITLDVSTGGIMVRTQIQLTEEQAIEVKRVARVRGVSMAEVIREAVDSVLKPGVRAPAEERRVRALGALGRFSSGRRDVSTNHDKYLGEIFKK